MNAKPEAARFTINWLSAAGTGVFVAALISGVVLRLSAAQWKSVFVRTAQRVVPTDQSCFKSVFQRSHASSRACLFSGVPVGDSPSRMKQWPAPL